MHSRAICIVVVSAIWCSSLVFGFDDPISVIGRIKWNYTKYEENLWNSQYANTSIPLIYRQHIPFLLQTIGVEETTLIAHNATDYIPFVPSVYNATVHVDKVWDVYQNFSRWFSNKRIEAEIISTIDEIPGLENAMNAMWNKSSTQLYFDSFRKVRKVQLKIKMNMADADNTLQVSTAYRFRFFFFFRFVNHVEIDIVRL